MPAREKAARDKSLSMLEALPIEERIRLYHRVHAARKTIAKRVAELTDPDRDKRHAAAASVGQPLPKAGRHDKELFGKRRVLGGGLLDADSSLEKNT